MAKGKKANQTVKKGADDGFSPLMDANAAPEGDDGGKEPTVKELLAQIQELKTGFDGLSAENKRLARTNMTLMAQPQGGAKSNATAAAPQAPELSLDGLPDPMEKPEEYQRAVAARTAQYVRDSLAAEQRAQQAQSAQSRSQQEMVDQLWDDFREKYEDLADKEDIVKLAAEKVVTRAKMRGLDTQALVFKATDQFFEDVAEEASEIISKLQPDEDGEDGDEDDAADAGRTAGVFGGFNPAGGAVAAKPGNSEDKGLAGDIAEFQHKNKLY